MYSNGRLIIAGDDEGATLRGMNYCYETLLVVRPAMFFASCCLLMCMLMHFLHVKLLAQWLQLYSADGGATLRGPEYCY